MNTGFAIYNNIILNIIHILWKFLKISKLILSLAIFTYDRMDKMTKRNTLYNITVGKFS